MEQQRFNVGDIVKVKRDHHLASKFKKTGKILEPWNGSGYLVDFNQDGKETFFL